MNRLHGLSGKILFKLLHPLVRIYGAAFSGPRTRILVTDGRGNVLLMRGWFGRQRWDLPGGGVKRGEAGEVAAARELKEETGLIISPKDLQFIGHFSRKVTKVSHEIILFHTVHNRTEVSSDSKHRLEVLEVAWWPIARLPQPINMFVIKALRSLEGMDS